MLLFSFRLDQVFNTKKEEVVLFCQMIKEKEFFGIYFINCNCFLYFKTLKLSGCVSSIQLACGIVNVYVFFNPFVMDKVDTKPTFFVENTIIAFFLEN